MVNGRRYQTVRLRTTMTPRAPGPIELHGDDERSVVTIGRRGIDPFFDQLLPGDAKQVEVAGRADARSRCCRCRRRAGRPISAARSAPISSTSPPSRRRSRSAIRSRCAWRSPARGNLRDGDTAARCRSGTAFRRYDAQPVKGEDGDDRRVFEQVVIPELGRRPRDAGGALQLLRSRRARLPDDHPRPDRRSRCAAAAPSQRGASTPRPPSRRRPPPRRRSAATSSTSRTRPGALQAARRARSTRGAWLVLLQRCRWRCSPRVLAWARRRERLAADPRLVRFRAAGRDAQRALAVGARAGWTRALRRDQRRGDGYLAAKLDLPPGAVERERVLQRLGRRRRAPTALEPRWRASSRSVERARYAPAAPAAPATPALALADAHRRRAGAPARARAPPGARRCRCSARRCSLAPARADEPAADGVLPGQSGVRRRPVRRRDRRLRAGARRPGRRAARSTSTSATPTSSAATSAAPSPATSAPRRLLPRDPDVAREPRVRARARQHRGARRAALAAAGLSVRLPRQRRRAGGRVRRAVVAVLGAADGARCCWPRARRGAGPRGRGRRACWPASSAAAWPARDARSRARRRGRRRAGDTPVRFEPTATGTEHFAVTPGAACRVHEERDGWLLGAPRRRPARLDPRERGRADRLSGWP